MILHMYKTGHYNANTPPLRTYNIWNNLTYTLHTPLKHRILHANTVNTRLKSIIRCLFNLHTYKVQMRIYSKFRNLLKPTRDYLNLSQALCLLTSSYL